MINHVSYPLTCFNSTLVQLKDKRKRMLERLKASFNSTLVQLKAVVTP